MFLSIEAPRRQTPNVFTRPPSIPPGKLTNLLRTRWKACIRSLASCGWSSCIRETLLGGQNSRDQRLWCKSHTCLSRPNGTEAVTLRREQWTKEVSARTFLGSIHCTAEHFVEETNKWGTEFSGTPPIVLSTFSILVREARPIDSSVPVCDGRRKQTHAF